MYCCCCFPRNCSRRFYRLVVLCPNYPGHSFKTSKCCVPIPTISTILVATVYIYIHIHISPGYLRLPHPYPSLKCVFLIYSWVCIKYSHECLIFLMVKKVLCPSRIFSNPILICFHRFQCFQGPPRSRLPNTFDHTHHPRHLLPGKAQLDTRHGISIGKTVGK